MAATDGCVVATVDVCGALKWVTRLRSDSVSMISHGPRWPTLSGWRRPPRTPGENPPQPSARSRTKNSRRTRGSPSSGQILRPPTYPRHPTSFQRMDSTTLLSRTSSPLVNQRSPSSPPRVVGMAAVPTATLKTAVTTRCPASRYLASRRQILLVSRRLLDPFVTQRT